jgi:dethiobiotin synthetase
MATGIGKTIVSPTLRAKEDQQHISYVKTNMG